MYEWVAIDFETATSSRASACALGATVVRDSGLAERRSWLIQPPGNAHDPWNTAIHGIRPSDTAGAPSFREAWPEIEAFLDGRLVVAHYAGFDLGVLRAECFAHGLTPQEIPYACTVVMGRQMWRGLPSYSLPWVCDHLGIDLLDHHDAGADARACAEVGMRLLAELDVATFAEAADRLKVRLGAFGPLDVRCLVKHAGKVRASPNPDADPEHPLFGVSIVFTGTLSRWTRAEAAALAADRGAACMTAVSKKTDFLVVGIQDPRKLRADGISGKMRRAAELARAGVEIQILTELEFERLLD
ncbi:MAG TPA: exonuclease domain-containing protein [Gemmatimonadaceae bacterium]|nr:exonuclease domain-containing protein [Gemmatimonadaceae bacterium]